MESAENKNSDIETKMLKEQENHQGQTDDYNYSKKEFWNDRFGKTTGNFDWYADWTQLKPKFSKLINVDSSVLMVGCGNSKMSTQMIQDGYKNITNISLSDELASIDVEYKKDLETEHNKLQNEIDEIKQLISTTETSALLLDNLQKDVESEVE